MSARVKMAKRGAGLIIALAIAPAAQAQRLEPEPLLGIAPAGPSFQPPRIERPARPEMFPDQTGLGVSTRTYTEHDGSILTRRGLIGSVGITSGLEAGVGLYSVTDAARKHNEFKRNWSFRDVTPKNHNIAAVGMRLKF